MTLAFRRRIQILLLTYFLLMVGGGYSALQVLARRISVPLLCPSRKSTGSTRCPSVCLLICLFVGVAAGTAVELRAQLTTGAPCFLSRNPPPRFYASGGGLLMVSVTYHTCLNLPWQFLPQKINKLVLSSADTENLQCILYFVKISSYLKKNES